MAYRDKDPSKKNNKYLGLKKATAILAIGGSAALGAACSNETTSATPNHEVGTSQGHDSNTSQEGVDETLPLLDIENQDTSSYPYYRQLDAVLPFLDEHRQESLDALSSYLDDPNDLTGDKKQAQIDLNVICANMYTAAQQSNRTLARNLVSGALKNNGNNGNNLRKLIQSGETEVINRYAIDQVSKPFNAGTIVINTESYEIKPNTNTRLMNIIDENKQQAYNFYIQDLKDKDGQHVTPVIIATAIAFSPGFVFGEDVADWQPQYS